jgi:hypothetical protein
MKPSKLTLLATGLTLLAGFAQAEATQQQSPVPMQGPDLIATFDGKTVSGVYADGLAVRESYLVGGGITYWDPNWGDKTGKWSVVNNLFCTFYDGMSGGCFTVERIGANCFDFLVSASSEEEALQPGNRKDYTARVSIDGAKSTCPDELSV